MLKKLKSCTDGKLKIFSRDVPFARKVHFQVQEDDNRSQCENNLYSFFSTEMNNLSKKYFDIV